MGEKSLLMLSFPSPPCLVAMPFSGSVRLCPSIYTVLQPAASKLEIYLAFHAEKRFLICMCSPADGTKVQVTDLGSTNGTYLDEEELATNRATEVYVGSRITFGESSANPCPSLSLFSHSSNVQLKYRPAKSAVQAYGWCHHGEMFVGCMAPVHERLNITILLTLPSIWISI